MYYIVYAFFYLFSLLPLWLLYGISDGVRFILYYIVPYRKQIVLANLARAFPEKTEAERRKIAWAFYRNFNDHFLETLKLLSASRSWLEKHFTVDNPEMYQQFLDQGRRCQLHLGHSFNWEFPNSLLGYLVNPFIVIYMPVRNKILDRLFNKLRSRTGTILVAATSARKEMMPYRHQPYLIALVADQAPGSPENAYWLNFFGQPTDFVRSPERGARAGDIPVVFVHFYKTRRGRYHGKLFLGDDHPAKLPEGELTRRYVRFLEWSIREEPTLYLWTHRRWKHEWRPGYGKLVD